MVPPRYPSYYPTSNTCRLEITQLYNDIVASVKIASDKYYKKSIKRDKYKVVPGWNRCVKKAYHDYRICFKDWVAYGRPRDVDVFYQMKNNQKIFKNKLKECKLNEINEISISIENNFSTKNYKKFWNEVRCKKSGKKVIDNIDGERCNNKIVDMFCDKFLGSLNAVDFNTREHELINKIQEKSINNNRTNNLGLSSETLVKYIQNLNDGIGHDGIHSSVLKNASDFFLDNVTVFLNSCLNHSFLPIDLLKGIITSILKDNNKDNSSLNNYRPVMQSSNILKIIEMYFLDYLTEKIRLNGRQFGFRKNMSTTHACFTLKEIVKK